MPESKVINMAVRRRSLIPHSAAWRTGYSLVATLRECEVDELIGALRFDSTPADIETIESFIGNLKQRIQERKQTHGNC